MIHFEQIREKMKEQYEQDSSRFFVEVTGQTLEEAIDNAAVELGLRRSLIDYEVLQKGASGFFVLNPKEWKIRAYEVRKINKSTAESETAAGINAEEQAQENINQDGAAYVFCAPDGVFLKVTPPNGDGR